MISTIENAMIARIQAAMDAPEGTGLGYRLKKLATYGGEFSDGIDRIVRDFPAVLIAFNGAQLVKEFSHSGKFKATFGVMVAAASLRNEKSARHGGIGAVGSYQLITDVLALLSWQRLGLSITPLAPRTIQPLMNDKAGNQLASVYAIDFETTFDLVPVDSATLDDFATFHADWDIPPHGNVTRPLPAEEADARTTVHLPIQGDPA